MYDGLLGKNVSVSNATVKAYEDLDFLKSDCCRPIRLELEYLKPDYYMDLYQIQSTLVIFGSARIKSPEEATANLEKALADMKAHPDSAEFHAKLDKAQQDLGASKYYQMARDFGRIVTKESQRQDGTDKTFVVITGGGGGIMEAGNRGAADAGGISAALNIVLPFEQHANKYITPDLSFQLHYFSIRKMHFLKRAKALGCFPGGFGTMDELFEALTLIQTGKIEPMPVILFGKAFWEKLVNWNMFVEKGLISEKDLGIFHYSDDAQEAWNFICRFYNRGN